MPRVTISRREYLRLQAAEEFCRAARIGYGTCGIVGNDQFPWFEQWMRLAPESKYDAPKPLSRHQQQWAKKERVSNDGHRDSSPRV